MTTTDSTRSAPAAEPSAWVVRWSHLIPPQATVLDVACGRGRHVRWFAARGCRVTGVDRDDEAVAGLDERAEIVLADIEGDDWPFVGRRFDLVLVTNYLWRERLPEIVASVAPGGFLIYETFAAGNERIGKPSNPKFLLQPGELLRAARGLEVVAFEQGVETSPRRFVQRIVAARPASSGRGPEPTSVPASFPLLPSGDSARLKSSDSEDPP